MGIHSSMPLGSSGVSSMSLSSDISEVCIDGVFSVHVMPMCLVDNPHYQ